MTLTFEFRQGSAPLLVSMPHSGTDFPAGMEDRLTERGRQVPDTDWWLDRLYMGELVDRASLIRAHYSRYVIDLNRPIDGQNLYPGQPTPALCPLECFDGSPIYEPGHGPQPPEIEQRIEGYWRPYHEQLESELRRLQAEFGKAVLFDAHSIASRVPRLFPGKLPDINIGTFRGKSCAPSLTRSIDDFLETSPFSHVVDGRFVGGFITRRYGQPDEARHAVQLELSQATYMDEATQTWDDTKAEKIRPVLQEVMRVIYQWIEK